LAQDLFVHLDDEWRRSRPFGCFEARLYGVDIPDSHAHFLAKEEERVRNEVGSRCQHIAAAARIAHDVDDETVGVLLQVGNFISQLCDGIRRVGRREIGDAKVAYAHATRFVGAGKVEIARDPSESRHKVGRQAGGKHRRALSQTKYVAARDRLPGGRYRNAAEQRVVVRETEIRQVEPRLVIRRQPGVFREPG
jgi:hypothetical protein